MYYLVYMGLNKHLARYVDHSPFLGWDPLDSDMHEKVKEYYPKLSLSERSQLLRDLQDYVTDNGIISRHMEYED